MQDKNEILLSLKIDEFYQRIEFNPLANHPTEGVVKVYQVIGIYHGQESGNSHKTVYERGLFWSTKITQAVAMFNFFAITRGRQRVYLDSAEKLNVIPKSQIVIH